MSAGLGYLSKKGGQFITRQVVCQVIMYCVYINGLEHKLVARFDECQGPQHVHAVAISARSFIQASYYHLIVTVAYHPMFAPQRPPEFTREDNRRQLFSAMGRGSETSFHSSWNQRSSNQAPHPHRPEASEAISFTGSSGGGARNDTSFHCEMKICHHTRFDRNSRFRRIGCG